MQTDDLCQRAAALADCAGLHGKPQIEPLHGSGNNQGFRLLVDGRQAFLKAYFRHPDDPRDRLGAEFAFLRYAWNHGVRTVPEPLAADSEHGLALYEFICGRGLERSEITESAVLHAIDFYQQINHNRFSNNATRLPTASEACFSMAEHIACVETRIERLRQAEAVTPVDRDAGAFVANELTRAWNVLTTRLDSASRDLGIEPNEPIADVDRRLSPSDFGFHNALLTDGKTLRFLDFEYAGWDDPAKLVCDFFCQPEVPVPAHLYDWFASEVASDLPDPEQHRRRMDLLLPVYRVKWCCIMLNVFLPTGSRRRSFAKGESDMAAHKREQLEKAQQALAAAVSAI